MRRITIEDVREAEQWEKDHPDDIGVFGPEFYRNEMRHQAAADARIQEDASLTGRFEGADDSGRVKQPERYKEWRSDGWDPDVLPVLVIVALIVMVVFVVYAIQTAPM